MELRAWRKHSMEASTSSFRTSCFPGWTASKLSANSANAAPSPSSCSQRAGNGKPGADGNLPKPFDSDELLAHAIPRRAKRKPAEAADVIILGNLSVNLQNRSGRRLIKPMIFLRRDTRVEWRNA